MAKKVTAGGHDEKKTVKCTLSWRREFSAWAHELAKYDARQLSVVVRLALRDYALKVGFRKPPES